MLLYVVTCPEQCGPTGKVAFCSALSGSASDWLLIDDAVNIVSEARDCGAKALHIWVRGRGYAPEGIPWRTGLSECGSAISELRNQKY